ncbi:MAG: helix-turn-helix domain-containing protein [Sulfuricurvum sp.]|nr:helix-turn-helix domain-containing protein [Sulfuricurvum sp.]
MSPSEKRWLSPDDLIELYNFKKKWQDKMRSKKLIPYKKLGGYVRYDRLEIDAWIERHSVVSEESA